MDTIDSTKISKMNLKITLLGVTFAIDLIVSPGFLNKISHSFILSINKKNGII